MNETPTAQFIRTLANLKHGDLSQLRMLKGCDLQEDLAGFDLFTGLWWTLRKQSSHAPRRETAWLVAKLYAQFPIPQAEGHELPALFGKINGTIYDRKKQRRFIDNTDAIMQTQTHLLEYPLCWALNTIRQSNVLSLDWVKLTDDLSAWHNELVRQKWAEAFRHASYNQNKEKQNVD